MRVLACLLALFKVASSAGLAQALDAAKTPPITAKSLDLGGSITCQAGKICDASQVSVVPSDTSTSATISQAIGSRILSTTAAPVVGVGRIPSFVSIDGSGIPGIYITSPGVIMRTSSTSGTDVASVRIERISNYAGGTDGFENTALKVANTVSDGTVSNEDAAHFILDNYASAITGGVNGIGPQNVALRVQAFKRGTGPTWLEASEIEDRSQVNLAANTSVSPTTAFVGREMVIAANGPDNNRNRVGFDLITARPFNSVHTGYAGDPATIGVGIRLVKQAADTAANRFGVGLSFGSSGAVTDFDTGIDFSKANFSTGGSALTLAQGQNISFTFDNSRKWNFQNGQMQYLINNSAAYWITDAGNIVTSGSRIRTATSFTPSSSSAPCDTGEQAWDRNYEYRCVAQNTWKRAALVSW